MLHTHKVLITVAAGLLISQIGCTRDPVNKNQNDQVTTKDTQVNNSGPAPVSGDARAPGPNPEASNAADAKDSSLTPIDRQAEKNSATNTTVGNGDSVKKAAEPAPVDNGNQPKDSKGIVGSPVASNLNTKKNSVPENGSSQIDVSRYSYAQRGEFKSFMQARLEGIDQNLKTLKTKTDAPKGGGDTVLANLTKKQGEIVSKLGTTDSVRAENWDSYKTGVRDDVSLLERSVQQLSSVAR